MKYRPLVSRVFSSGDRLEKRLLQKHIIAILILLVMVSFVYIIITGIITTQKDGAEIINKSGKQRMLTQRVLTFYYQKNKDFEIRTTLEELEKNNEFLLSKIEDKSSISHQNEFIKNIFYKEKGILKVFESYKNSLKSKEDVNKFCEKLFVLYDKLTMHYEELIEEEINKLLYYEAIILIVSVMTILLEGFFIFRPALIEVHKNHRSLKKLNSKLDQKVKNQVKKLRAQEEALIQKAKMAEMGEMLSDISHQWKQPLTILSLQLDTIQMDINENRFCKEQINEDLNECFKLIKHMHQTIEEFKNFYKPDTSKKSFDLIKSINEVISLERTSLYKHNIEIEFNNSSSNIFMVGFEGQFKQVLLSLINNSIEQITNNIKQNIQEKNSGKVRVKIKQTKEKVIVKISDNAGGIKEDIKKKIFNPYFSTKHNEGGSGIGLYMAKTIIEKNFNGKLCVKNIYKGACFEISFYKKAKSI